MQDGPVQLLLPALLDSWDRNNRILVNLLGAIPEPDLDVRSTDGGHSVGELFAHMHYVRLAFVAEDAPEFATALPAEEWRAAPDRGQMAEMLNESARVVRDAVRKKIDSGGEMLVHFDHPMLFLQQLIWHEGYHHGQIKLALKLAGRPISNEVAGPLTWRVWMNKT